jgi:predicted ATPase
VLPAPLTSFVGRVDELTTLGAALASHRLVTLVGAGGSGKSRLAVEIARTGSLHGFVELSATDPGGPDTALPLAVLAACGLRDEPGVAPSERLTAYLRDRPGLLVLDNCEHVRTRSRRSSASSCAAARHCACSPPAGSASGSSARRPCRSAA